MVQNFVHMVDLNIDVEIVVVLVFVHTGKINIFVNVVMGPRSVCMVNRKPDAKNVADSRYANTTM